MTPLPSLLLDAAPRAALLAALAAVANSPLAFAQDLAQDRLSAPTDLTPPRVPIHSGVATPEGGGPGGLWACGRNYKVSLHDGFVFYPYVGAAIEHQPLRWRTASARLGGAELVAPGAPRPDVRGDYRCEYDLGEIVECYDLRDRDVEQTFVVEAKPAIGELVIVGEVTTPLLFGATSWIHGGVKLSLPDGRQVVDYGAATAVDANGRRFPMQTSCEGDTIRLRLDAASVAAAAFPLVVDPLIANTLLANGGTVNDSDVLHETLSAAGANARTWVTFAYDVAANDSDVAVRRFGTGFVGAGINTHVEISTWDATHPRLALAPGASKVVVVYATGPTGGAAERFVYVHPHHVANLGLGVLAYNPFDGAAGQNEWRPDVGGRLTNGNEVLVVFQGDLAAPFANTASSNVIAGVWNADTETVSVPRFAIRNNPNHDQERPCINQAARGTEWMVAYQVYDNATVNDDWDTVVLEVDAGGTVSATTVALAQAGVGTEHKLAPEIAGAGGRYCLTYVLQQFQLPNPKPQNATGEQLFVQRIDFDHTTDTGSRPWPELRLGNAASAVFTIGGIGFDDVSECHWCVASKNLGNGNYVVRKLGYHGDVVESGTVAMTTGFVPVPGGVTFNSSQREFMLVFGGNDGSANGNQALGARMTYDAVQPPQTYGFACGSGVWAGTGALQARQQIGSERLSLELANTPNVNGFAFLVLSFDNFNQGLGSLGLVGCDLLVDPNAPNYLGLLGTAVSGSAARLRLDVPEFVPPMTLFMQWAYTANGANPAGLLASEGLRLELGR